MNALKMTIEELHKHLKAPIVNKFHWCSNHDDLVLLRVWSKKDRMRVVDGVPHYLVVHIDRVETGTRKTHQDARLKHVEMIKQGARCILIPQSISNKYKHGSSGWQGGEIYQHENALYCIAVEKITF